MRILAGVVRDYGRGRCDSRHARGAVRAFDEYSGSATRGTLEKVYIKR